MEFLTCVAGMENDNKDGVLLFPIYSTGHTTIIDSTKGKPVSKADAGTSKVRVTISDFFGKQGKPKAKIDIGPLKHASTFPAERLARDEIQKRLRWYLPDVEIDGEQKFMEKRLLLKNETEERLTVWINYRTYVRKEKKYEWEWQPGEPGDGPLQLVVEPGKYEWVVADETPITASRIRLWAESETGERWEKHRKKDLWLVEENAKSDGRRNYYAEKIDVYTYNIKPQPGPKVYTERALVLKNEAPESLNVQLKYRTRIDGQLVWRGKKLEIGPRQTLRPRDDRGMRIRASRLYMVAQGENRRYERYQSEPLWLVEESDGKRAYRADKIGEFVHVFDPIGQGARQGVARVRSSRADIFVNQKKAGELSQGQRFNVVGKNGAWARVEYEAGGEVQRGWVRESDLTINSIAADEPPSTSERTLQVVGSYADVMADGKAIARLSRGQRFTVLEERGDWIRVEVKLEGQPRHGWVRKQTVRVQ